MVIGHTVQREGISQACGGRVWRIDVGLSAAYAMGSRGKAQVLEIGPRGAKVLSSGS